MRRGDWEEEQIYGEQGGGKPDKRKERKLKYEKQVRAHPTYVKYVCP